MIAIIAALWGVVISAIYMLRAYRAVFFGPLIKAEGWINTKDLSFYEFAPITMLLVVLLITGIFPHLILNLVNTAFR